jgi:alpha-1,6-mannosyltransferase
MRILHIANFYGDKSGGIRTTIHNLGHSYIQRGHEFTFIVPGSGFYCEETPTGRMIHLPSILIPFSGGYRIIRRNRDVKNLITTLKPDAIEISDRFTLSGIGTWARKRGIPTVVFSHETLSGLVKTHLKFSLTRLVNWHNSRLATRFKYVIATTQFAAREFKNINIPNLVTVPLGVDLANFHPSNRDETLRTELLKGADILLVHCGRLSPEKKPERSMQALELLLQQGINARLVYVGIGPLQKKMMQASKNLPVTFLGYVAGRQKLAAILSSADISLAPGPIETFCLAAMESLASGTPVVASNTSAVGEFLLLDSEQPVGAIFDNTAPGFVEAIKEVMRMRSRNQNLAHHCHQQAENFPWSATVSQMLRLHDDPQRVKKAQHRLRAA